jgi:molecular chaperone DnaJ
MSSGDDEAGSGTKPKACATCGGQGKIRHVQGFFTLERTCPSCHGRGQVIDPLPDPTPGSVS